MFSTVRLNVMLYIYCHSCIYYDPGMRNCSDDCSPWSKQVALWQPASGSSYVEHSMSDVAALLDNAQTSKQPPSLGVHLWRFQKTPANQHTCQSSRRMVTGIVNRNSNTLIIWLKVQVKLSLYTPWRHTGGDEASKLFELQGRKQFSNFFCS